MHIPSNFSLEEALKFATLKDIKEYIVNKYENSYIEL